MSHHKNNDFKADVALIIIFISLIVFGFYFFSSKQRQVQANELNEIPKEEIQDPTKGLELLGRAVSSYAGGTDGRHKNIELGVSRMNGKVILPGEEFSFKDTLGTTTEADGFSVERVFLNGEVTKGIGGGLCQVSTALFRAALSSGLPITQRSNHSFTVSLYDVGLDATYSDPGPDLKFKNDTENPIVIKGKTENLKAIFEIYGKSDGRIASTTEAKITDIKDILPTKYVWVEKLEEGQIACINNPQIGYTATVTYGVLYKNGEYKGQDFVSNYKPLQRVCYIVGDNIFKFDINKPNK